MQGSASRPETKLWGNPATCSPTRKSIQDLFRATPVSTGLHLSSSICMVLTPKVGMLSQPNIVYGSLSKGTVGLLLGKCCPIYARNYCCSWSHWCWFWGRDQDDDSFTMCGISVVKTSQRLAKLFLLPAMQIKNQIKKDKKGKDGFVSSDTYWLQATGPQTQELTLFTNGKNFLVFYILAQKFQL